MAWFSRDVDELVARGKYGKAIQLLTAEVKGGNRDPRARLQLADALISDKRGPEAVPLLIELADEYAADGFAAKAIAVLKKIQRIDPGRRGVDERLANLIDEKTRTTAARLAAVPKYTGAGYEPAGAVFSAEDFEAKPAAVPDPDARVAAARAAHWEPSTYEAPREAAPLPIPPAAAPTIEVNAVPIEVEPEVEPEPEPALVQTPLFSGFSRDELLAVMRGLQLRAFEAGDIILTEGDPGDSLFVVTTGLVKAYVKRSGQQVLVRRMAEGDFFGEISILSGKPRTATVTAATAVELLELDRQTLDGITAAYPRVRDVLEDFYVARASTQEEAIQRGLEARAARSS